MPIGDVLLDYMLNIATNDFQVRQGRQVPHIDDVQLQNGAVQIGATFWYSDLANSTQLATQFPPDVAARVIRGFLRIATQAVTDQRGRPRSFDGDRVMGVFLGDDGAARAVRAGMLVAGLITHVMAPIFDAQFPVLAENGFILDHGTGIAHGVVTAVRAGVRGNNDLVWVGEAPNVAAKLSSDRSGLGKTLVTRSVLDQLPPELRFGSDSQPLWTRGVAVSYEAFGTDAYMAHILSPDGARRLTGQINSILRRRARRG